MNLLSIKQVAAKLSFSESWLWKLIASDPTFPRSISFGLGDQETTRARRWVEADIDEWIRARKRTSKEANANENGRTGGEVHQAAGTEVPAEG